MPWGVLITACAVGLGISLAVHEFPSPLQSASGVTLAIHASFFPAVAAVAFLAYDPHRNLTAALPAPAWFTAAAHTVMALPVIGVTAYLQLELTTTKIASLSPDTVLADVRWPAQVAELVAWSAIAAAAASVVGRTRWRELGGAVAAPAALALIVLASAASPRPAWIWWVVAATAGLIAAWESRDPWLRLRHWMPPRDEPSARHRSESRGA